MKITDITTWIVNLDFRNVIIVKVQTGTGISGMLETVMKRKTLSIQQSIIELNRYLGVERRGRKRKSDCKSEKQGTSCATAC